MVHCYLHPYQQHFNSKIWARHIFVITTIVFIFIFIFLPQSIQIDPIDVSIYGRLCTWSQTAEYGTSEIEPPPPTEYRLKSFARAEKN